ncbi:condensin complex subunit 2-like [Daphnia pulex]|uniref:condensin complex subunit 2-like n=1 Tax=Daphnia pulex TaxID=6669 RepID=UPI001EDF21C2|nr:condensin complex subunit 2-like [Daphnia pulex]XP_046441320.1 condensin complex subunit 2-like [Daphnia pulex]XP_046441321.1 condensin complex subunit 2-like [Daphnia pulex]
MMAVSMTPTMERFPPKPVTNSRRSISLFSSPKVRKSIGFSNVSPALLLETPHAETGVPLLDPSKSVQIQNNDEQELRERQKQRAAEMQQQSLASPSTPADRRKSMGPATGMTNAALVEHYSNCIKLSAENKINMKNAFNLQLIDCMSEMLRKKDPEMNNFQAASCTLDASAKIYAYRVDCVHIDTIKMAGGLGRTGDEGQQEQEGNGQAEGEQDEANKVKKKAKKKNKKTIETNVDHINMSKFDLEYDVDPLFKKNSARFDEGRNGGVNFLTSLMLKDDGCQLIMDSDSLCNAVSHRLEQTQTSCPVVQGLDSAEICPTLKGFSFTTWDPTNDDLMGLLQSPTKRKHEEYQVPLLPTSNEDHAFDMDAVPETYGGNDSENETHLGMEDIDEEEGIDRHRNGDGRMNPVPILAGNGKNLGIVELKDQLNRQDYSYFSVAVRSAWAGPLHWRLNKLGQRVDPNREVKKKRRKDAFVMSFEDIPDFGNDFKPAKSTSKLTNATLLQWLPEKITLPEDLHYGLKEFSQSFTRPMLSVRSSTKTGPSQDLEGILSPYDYSNRRDADNFCPEVNADSSYNDDHHDDPMTFNDQTADFASQSDGTKTFGQFSGDNLIAAPNMVAKIQINYAKVAKKMDMRRLKSTMWNMLNQPNETDNAQKPTAGNPKGFCQMYNQIPNLLPQKMAENLSVALAFAALLHLANENTLHLAQEYGNLDDFAIVHPN